LLHFDRNIHSNTNQKSQGQKEKKEKQGNTQYKMPSFVKTLGAVVVGLAACASALPSQPRLTASQMKIYEVMKRQEAAAANAGLTDTDILTL
jgi:hypothetical protein